MEKIKISAVSRRRLTVLAEFLDKLPEEVFHISQWIEERKLNGIGIRVDSKGNLGTGITVDEMNECGTTACALGWACTILSFKKAGLKLYMGNGIPHYGQDSAYGAAMSFFHISAQMSHILFSPTYYCEEQAKDAKAVSRRIRECLANPVDTISRVMGI